MACGPERATTPVDVDGWPGWGNKPKSWLGESADAGREVSVAGALGLYIRVGTGDDNWFSWRDSPMLFIVMCKSVDFRTVSGDGGWQCVEACGCQLYVLAPRYGVCRSSERLFRPNLEIVWIGSGLISRLRIPTTLSGLKQEK